MTAKLSRAVLDPNVLLSALLWPGSVPATALKRLVNSVELITSVQLQLEYVQVFHRPKFDSVAPLANRIALLEDFLPLMKPVSITHTITVCRDPRDNKFLELALSGRADLILTGDDDLLQLHPWNNIAILAPANYLAR